MFSNELIIRRIYRHLPLDCAKNLSVTCRQTHALFRQFKPSPERIRSKLGKNIYYIIAAHSTVNEMQCALTATQYGGDSEFVFLMILVFYCQKAQLLNNIQLRMYLHSLFLIESRNVFISSTHLLCLLWYHIAWSNNTEMICTFVPFIKRIVWHQRNVIRENLSRQYHRRRIKTHLNCTATEAHFMFLDITVMFTSSHRIRSLLAIFRESHLNV